MTNPLTDIANASGAFELTTRQLAQVSAELNAKLLGAAYRYGEAGKALDVGRGELSPEGCAAFEQLAAELAQHNVVLAQAQLSVANALAMMERVDAALAKGTP